MRSLSLLLTVLLALSIALNFYFYTELTLFKVDSENAKDVQYVKSETPKNSTENKLLEEAQDAFKQHNINAAIQTLQALHHASPKQAETLTIQWFETILQQLKTERFSPHGEFVQEFLRVYPYDPYFLYLEIEFYDWKNSKIDTLLELYQLLKGNLPANLAEIITIRIKELYQVRAEQLKELGAWDILASMIESILPMEPNNSVMLLDLAESYAMQQQFGLMDSVLAYLPEDNEKAEQLRQFQSNLAQQEPLQPSIDAGAPLIKEGDHYIVNAKIGEHYQVSLLIDTGASTTVISQATFDALPGYVHPDFVGNYNINTANGNLVAPVYRFSSLSIGNSYVDDIAIVVLPLENMDSDGLLGMNFLRAFRFEIDQAQDMLILAPNKA
ncbi:clan AA aspartic protease [Paraneptunicella aestuarii]|uniref:retropepsin-like aspartic protease family protein n=1 Tax=Paraneptunicella aestuarii TaxID=2831148 RepID=UPI001E5739D3|nr:retropepsin-like aspartic protease [Paraneptunicella aestuarii]UAA37514.1 clan AA aspartic protease [Paraneptunicella aestuarii]